MADESSYETHYEETSERSHKKRKKKKRSSMDDEPSGETHNEETSEQSHKKKKKRKSKRETLDVSVDFVEDAPDRAAPVVGYFSTGFNPLESNDNGVKVFRHKRYASRMELIVSPSESNLEFVGKSYAGEAAAPQICTYALGVLDKESQTLKIVPIAANKVCFWCTFYFGGESLY